MDVRNTYSCACFSRLLAVNGWLAVLLLLGVGDTAPPPEDSGAASAGLFSISPATPTLTSTLPSTTQTTFACLASTSLSARNVCTSELRLRRMDLVQTNTILHNKKMIIRTQKIVRKYSTDVFGQGAYRIWRPLGAEQVVGEIRKGADSRKCPFQHL